ncbi:MAG: histidine phosphatase family protein [Myxococcales bacterium]
MKTLLVLRHGKAAQEEAGSDRDRPLTQRGKRAAEMVGHLLRDDDLVPDRVICSSAERARDTARRVAAAAKFGRVIDELDELYLAEPEAYITAVRQLSGDAERVLVVGHNPGLEALALILTGEPVALPTAGLAVCSLPIASFADLTLQVRGNLTRFVRPKEQND